MSLLGDKIRISMSNNLVLTQTLLSIPGYFLVRCVEATIFGVFHNEINNRWQISMLLAFHIAYVAHLMVFRPYKKRFMQLCEVIASTSECLVLVIICSVSFEYNYNDYVSTVLMTFAYLQAFIGFGYDFVRGIGILYRKASVRLSTSRKKTSEKL